MRNIAFAGGGTGGHVFPIKSLIEYIYENKNLRGKINNIFWFGTKDGLEKEIATNFHENDIFFVSVYSGKLRRDFSLKSIFLNFVDIFKLTAGFFQSLYNLKRQKIDIIFCKGGFVALPVVFAARMLGKEIYVHESDTAAGLTNKMAARFATKIFSGFPETFKNGIHTGQILSKDFIPENEEDYLTLEGFDLSKTNILIMGGSQGAEFIYRHILTVFRQEPEKMSNFNFFIVLGTKNLARDGEFNEFSRVKTFGFLPQKQLGYLYQISDISITRGGATSMAEQKVFGNKLIIVPLPYTGGNHQYRNAKYYEDRYGDVILNQDSTLWDKLEEELIAHIGYKKNVQPDFEEVNASRKRIYEEIFGDL